MPNPFPPELRTLAFVPRWAIIATTFKDYVAGHSFYVGVYSYMVAETIDWFGPRDYLMLRALLHDHDESITSDITGPVKSHILDQDKADSLLEELSNERMGGLLLAYDQLEDRHSDGLVKEAGQIVEVADKMDALFFLIMNFRAGNTMVVPALKFGMKSLEGAWRRLPTNKETIDKTWNTVVLPSIAEHYKKGARGCAPGAHI